MNKKEGKISIGFITHVIEELYRDMPIFIEEISEADVFVEECAFYIPKDDLEKELEERRRAAFGTGHLPYSAQFILTVKPTFHDRLVTWMHETKKMWLLEESPVKKEEGTKRARFMWEAYENFFQGNLGECLRNYERMLELQKDHTMRRDEKFLGQLLKLHENYPEKSILTLRGAAHMSVYYELKKKGVNIRKFYPYYWRRHRHHHYRHPVETEVSLKHFFDKEVTDLEILRCIPAILLKDYFHDLSKKNGEEFAYHPSEHKAREVSEQLDEKRIRDISLYLKKKLRYDNKTMHPSKIMKKASELIGRYLGI